MTQRLAAVLILAALGCASPRTRGLSAETPEATVSASPGLALFARLTNLARRYHVFAPNTERNLGQKWDDSLPRLREEFASARSPEALTLAAWHFGNSLRDVHCQFRPSERGDHLRLGFRVAPERRGDEYVFFVDRVSPALLGVVAVGDTVVAVDGVAAGDLLNTHEFVSNQNAFDNIALDVALYLTDRRTAFTSIRAGDASTWEVIVRATGKTKSFAAHWRQAERFDDHDFQLDYESQDCVTANPKNYGQYKLTARGYRVCLYTSDAPIYRDYPIVRQVSFRYDWFPHGPLADYELLRERLASAAPKGVILDVQDNGGGLNPNLFLEWFSSIPYEDTYTHVVLDETLLGADLALSSVNDAVKAWYARELALRAPNQRFSRARPFMCKPETCDWNNLYTPKRQVTRAPVALLLGPGCASSCDALALHFDRSDIGPILGRSAMAGFTTHRVRVEVGASDGAPALGSIDFAVSYDALPGTEESIEGHHVKLDVPIPRTADNAAHYDALLVDEAIRALTSWKRPPAHP